MLVIYLVSVVVITVVHVIGILVPSLFLSLCIHAADQSEIVFPFVVGIVEGGTGLPTHGWR